MLVATAQSQVNSIALWTGLISSIVSVVLAIVAILFSLWVNDRSAKVTEKTVQTLQKIETNVDRVSQDISGLIKVAWDRIIINNDISTRDSGDHNDQIDANALAQGVAAELRAEFSSSAVTEEHDKDASAERLEALLDRIETTIEPVLAQSATARTGNSLDRAIQNLERLSPLALAIVYSIVDPDDQKSRHLTFDEYQYLRQRPDLRQALSELRSVGLLLPRRSPVEAKPVYFPPLSPQRMRSLLLLAPPPDPEALAYVKRNLVAAGYPSQLELPIEKD